MSHIKQNVLKTTITALFLSASIPAITANAAVNSTSQYTPGRTMVYKTTFNDVEGLNEAVLDWRNQSVEFTFDMMDADWTDNLELLLSADPLGRVNTRTPIMVQFNNSAPMPVVTRGQGFDARIQLDAAKIRPRRNKIKFTYKTPVGAECLTPQHGGWRLDFKNSFVVVKARAKSRSYQLREVETRLSDATTAPKSVRILARGQNTAKLQALAAQGIGLRMKNLPEFKTTSGVGEFEVILGRRDELYKWVTDKDILGGKGPRILVHEGRPMRLVITGDTDAEVMATAQAFTEHQLPSARRATTSLGEMQMQPTFQSSQMRVDGTAKISDLGGTYFDGGWGPKPKVIKFDVSDPAASQGEVLLRIASNKNVSDNSRVALNLNGQSLGFTNLNKARKSVAFNIPAGTLQGTDNVLTITPELGLAKVSGCNFTQELPGFYLGAGSKIKIKTPIASPVAELSKLTATGAPFSLQKGSDTVVMLPANSSRDYAASLKVLAKLAKSSGTGWTDAEFIRSNNFTAISANKNILFIGPHSGLNATARKTSPKGLSSALKGQTLKGSSGLTASNDRYASSDADDTIRIFAALQTSASHIRQGGVAAIYPSPLGSTKVMGVITNVPGRSFSKVATDLVRPTNWSRVEGSVTRWNTNNVLMAQTAMAVPGFVGPSRKTAKGFTLPDFKLPSFGRENFGFGEINLPWAAERFDSLKQTTQSFFSGSKKNAPIVPRIKPAAPKIMPTKVTAPNIPQLRGYSKVQNTPKNFDVKELFSASKNWTLETATDVRRAWQRFDLKSSITKFQSSVRPMGNKIRTKFNSAAKPGEKAVIWGEHNMSLPAIILILVFGLVFLLMGLARPSARTGGHH